MNPPPLCLACESARFVPGPVVPVAALGRAWAADRAGNAPPPAAAVADWADRVRAATGADAVRFFRCTACGTEVSSPAQCWPEGSYTEDENYPPRWEFGRFLDDLGSVPVRVLELGAGQGTFLAMAAGRGHQGIGLDFNPAAVEVAKARGLDVTAGGFDRLGTGATDSIPFDAVALFHVIEHLPDPAAVLRQLTSFVRPGALLGISCPGARRFTRLIAGQQLAGRDFWDYPPHHVVRWSVPGLRAVLDRTGWDVIATAEEPLVLRDAAAQMGVTRALRKGYADNRLLTRAAIAISWGRLVLEQAMSRPTGLSIYTLARYRGDAA